MARIQLFLTRTNPPHEYRFLWPDGKIGEVEGLRLSAYVRFLGVLKPGTVAGRVAFPDCVVDTGSYLSIVPYRIWQHFLPGVVTHLPFHSSMPSHLRAITIAGGSFPYDLGQITVPLRDPDGGTMDVRVIAKFTRDHGTLNIPLTLGLRGGFLDGRKLKSTPDPAAPFGESWTLEDP